MVWSEFSIKIIGVNFGNSFLDNSNWDKISHSLAKKKNQFLEQQSATLFEMIKKNCKPNPIIQTYVKYIGQIYNIIPK